MDLLIDSALEEKNHHSGSQIARIITERWGSKNLYCPVCGEEHIARYANNKPVADYFCKNCGDDFELKSKQSKSDSDIKQIPDGAYHTMIERITSNNNPHLFYLQYASNRINNLSFVPKFYFTPGIIVKRKPLTKTARRAGWVGCNISYRDIPTIGKIEIIKNGEMAKKSQVIGMYKKAEELQIRDVSKRSWIFDILKCVEAITKNSKRFCLADVYAFAPMLKQKYPDNNNIEAKIRQQLQILRDKKIIEFTGKGGYSLI